MKSSLAAFILVFLWSGTRNMAMAKKETQYTNMWIAEVHGGEEVAQRVARDLGYNYKSPAEPFKDHYIFLRDDHPEVSKRSSQHLTRSLLDVDEVKWAEQQAIVERSKRGYLPVMKEAETLERQIDEAATLQDNEGNNVISLRGGYDWGGSRYGGSGYGSSGYGRSGSGFESSYTSSNTDASSNTVFVTVGGSDTYETILSNVMSQVGSNIVGAFIICSDSINTNMGNKLNYQLARSGQVAGGITMARLSGTGVSKSYVIKMVKQFQSMGQIEAGAVVVAFMKGSDAAGSVPAQQASPVAGNVATSEQEGDGSIVYVSVGRGDSAASIADSVAAALGSKKLGLLITTGNILNTASANTLVNNLATKRKLGGGGVAMLSVSSSGGTAGKRAIKSIVTQYTSMGVLGGDNVAVVVTEGKGNSVSSGTPNQGVSASNPSSGTPNQGVSASNPSSGTPNQGVSASNPSSGGSDSFNLGALGGTASGGNSNPASAVSSSSAADQTSKPSPGTKHESGSDSSESNTQATPTGGSSSNDKVIMVDLNKVDSVSDYVIEQLGDSLVCAIILSGQKVNQNDLEDLYRKLSLRDKLSETSNVAMMQVSQHDGSPVNAKGLFNNVNELMRKGQVGANEKVVVLTRGGDFDMNSFNEMMEEGNQGDVSKLGTFPTQRTDGKAMVATYEGPTKHIGCLSSKESAYKKRFNDPLWPKQWYAQDYRTTNVPVMDHNIVPVYKMGITGEGIYVAVVDDGVVHDHPDLAGNFDLSLSYDMCDDKPGSQPAPPNAKGDNSHGTKCAGEIAMVANNEICGVGVAYNAKIAGVRTLGPQTIEYGEAKGLIHKLKKIDLYSCSWGPTDDGKTLGRVGHMTDESFKTGTKEGRNGKGVIYVFSAGNGKKDGDNCALDGLINHIATIPIASVSQRGKTVNYSERCTAVFAGTYSGGNENDEGVATTDLNGKCTTTFSGTSAAAPIASGIITLVLQAKPELTYRDVMHLIAMSAEVAPLANNENIWYKNGAGFWVSNDFGFGLMNAENMVRLAQKWQKVPKRNTCVVAVELKSPQSFTVGDDAIVRFDTAACQDKAKDQVFYLEQIELASTIQYPFRGAISMKITSPAGTVSDILEPRLKDSDTDGLNEWSIKSVHNWGENPKGKWKIEVKANPVPEISSATGYVDGFTLLLHGTIEKPFYDTPRKYAGFRLPNGKTSEV